jgi:hypothetical protein
MRLACRAAVWQSRVRIPPGNPPLAQPRKIQEQKTIGAYTIVGGGVRGRPANHPPPPEYLLTQHRCKETSPPLFHTTTHNNSTWVHKTTNVSIVFMALILNGFEGATSLLGALERVGPENLDFFGPKWHSLRLCHFRAQKSLDFQGPPLPMPLVSRNDVAPLIPLPTEP